MKRIHASYFVLCIAAFTLAACSGPSHFNGGGGSGGGGGNGNATVSLMLTAQPESPTATPSHATLDILTTITGVTLNPPSGNPVVLSLSPASYPVNFLSQQSGGNYLGTVSVPAGTYDSITVTFGPSALTFYNTSGGAISGCANLSICKVTPQAVGSSAQVQSAPLPLTLTSGQEAGFALRFIASNALSFTNGTASINYGAQNAFEVVSLPRPGVIPILDTVENFTGQITALTAPSGSNAGSITVTSNSGVSLTATVPPSNLFNVIVNDPQTLCTNGANLSCLAENQIISIDADLHSDGTLMLTEADVLFLQAQDELQGLLFFPSGNPTSYTFVVTNKIVGSDNVLANAGFGDVFTLTLANNPTFAIDSEDTPVLTQFPSLHTLFQSSADLFSGQSVMVHVTSLANTNITADQVLLRFTDFSATVNTVSNGGATFTLTSSTIAPSILTQQLVNNAPPSVQTFLNTSQNTLVDGVSSIGSIAAGDSVSIRALFLPNSTEDFYAAKVRDTPQ